MERRTAGDAAPFYDTDTPQSYKPTLATGMLHSPLRYSIVRSTAPRFQEQHGALAVPFGCYNTDTGGKKTLASDARDTRRFYASSFISETPRFSRPWSSPATDAIYDVERLKDSKPATVEKELEWTPRNYAILRSRYNRFVDKKIGEGSDVIYDTDRGHKQTMYTAMLKSPIIYKSMGTPPQPGSNPASRGGRPGGKEAATAHLGPGAYDYKIPSEFQTSQFLPMRPLSSMASSTPRFGRRTPGMGLGLGSTWTPDKDAAAWSKGTTISRAEYLRPQYMPKSYLKK